MKIPGPHTRSTKAMSSEAHTKRVLKRVGGNSNSKASRRTAPNRIVMSESRTTAALRRCEWPANRGRTGEPLRCRWRRHGSARIGADAEVGSVRASQVPRNLPIPCRLSDVYGPRQTGMGAIVMERAMARIDKPRCSACGDEMDLSLLIPPFGGPYGLKVFTCPRCGRSKDYLIGRAEAA
jgi:predicted RNA-binding Zn-ribbon protein involved in translation (DUF1610 family)